MSISNMRYKECIMSQKVLERPIVKVLVCFLMILININIVYSQKERNNIYLFDCTGSMRSAKLWEPAKDALNTTIQTQTEIPGSSFTVIPFGDNPYEVFSFDKSQYQSKKKNIEKSFDNYISQARYTHISDVLKLGFDKTDINKDNKIYLLTDGMPNGGDSPEKVAQTIREWCRNHKNCRLFYVALTEGVINPVIQSAIDKCPDAFVVQCEGNVIPQIADISSDVYANIEELDKQYEISFSLPGEYSIIVNNNDSYFDVIAKGGKAKDGKILLSLKPKNGLSTEELHQILKGEDYRLPISIQCADKRYFIANPSLKVNISDKIKTSLTLADGVDEIVTPGAKWHDSFLWSSESNDQVIEWDLSPIFKNQLPNSQVSFEIETEENQPKDYRVWFNGNDISETMSFLVTPNDSAILQLVFNHEAKEGKRYFRLVPDEVISIDMINSQPLDKYGETTLRTEYSKVWNPLKTFLFWFGIVLLVAVIIWIFALKRIIFPIIKLSRIEMSGPGTYYVSRKIKGARKVVFTAKRKNQNILSKIFTGQIRYVKADHFSHELILEAAGGKKKVKLKSIDNSWDIYPTRIFKQYDKGDLINRETKEKSEIEFT